ncbi:MFS transporter, SP family,ral alpha glucoside:H+ symporter [Geosmithia morbida]|uniref:MFS transporter, SP family,ral alpha glucoside:H+ symporter n=1 Tax=Geosmithia morbida TaxID=1094350 RepID=A0A9P4YU90_9HYPO|nr:MFS transporter, SP family,ral alpha glucoside:H+ symporter [Geosmithia morbida]KAF4123203.1 MFS transporter, SP family,ral alpha glucoside:H+ symporter [Geosmithia morbida]
MRRSLNLRVIVVRKLGLRIVTCCKDIRAQESSMTITGDHPNEILYFAFGSNLSTQQMLRRCPSSTPVGLAHLAGWSWIINERGFANIIPDELLSLSESLTAYSSPGGEPPAKSSRGGVYGLLYLLPPADEERLDRCENVPVAYGKQHVDVLWERDASGKPLPKPEKVKALAYVDTERVRGSRPKEEYVARMRRGIDEVVKDWGLDDPISAAASSRRSRPERADELSPPRPTGHPDHRDAAARAARHEQTMTFRYAVVHYKPALLWATLMASTAVMEGYGVGIVSTFFSFQPFARFYGSSSKPGGQLTPFNDADRDGRLDSALLTSWQTAIAAGIAAGQVVGILAAPTLTSRLGYRRTALLGLSTAALVLLIPSASSFVGAPPDSTDLRVGLFLAGEVLLGIPWGLFQGISVPYISDVTPLKVRGPATTLVSAFSTSGQLLGAVVLRSTEELGLGPEQLTSSGLRRDTWAFRIPMLLQYAWVLPLLALFLMLPESPLSLLQHGRPREASASIRRLSSDPRLDAEATLDALRLAGRLAGGGGGGGSRDTGFLACFKHGNLRRTEITVMVYLTQQSVGLPLLYYASKVLQNAGVTEGNSILVNLGMHFMCVLATFASIPVLRLYRRRTAWIGGLSGTIACLVAIGVSGFYANSRLGAVMGWVIAAFIVGLAVVFNLTIGPMGYAIASEVPTTRLKGPTNSMARAALLVLVMGLEARAALVWVVTAVVALAWAYIRLPETKDRTPAEVDTMFETRVPARKWSTTRL